MKTIKIYTINELKKKFPASFDRAYEDYKDEVNDGDVFWVNEIVDSLKSLFKYSNIKLSDWNLSENSYSSYVCFDMEDEIYNLSGQRAFAWLENNLFSQFRENKIFINRVKKYTKWHDFTKYGEIPSCPFTGYCADEDFIESLKKDILSGCSLGEVYTNLADKASELIESEINDQKSEEYFIDYAMNNEYQYTKDGVQI